MNRLNQMGLSACVQLAAQQCGVIGRTQALECGLAASAVQRLVRERRWLRVQPSVYALWAPSSTAELRRQRLSAGVLWLGKDSAVSHRAAAMDWELDGIDTSPLEFSTTRDRRISRPGLIIHRTARLPPHDVVARNGLQVTSVARTLVDLATVVGPTKLELALESARHKRLVTVEQIQEALERSGPTHRGRMTLRNLLEEAPFAATESPIETAAWQLFRDAGLPLPVRQHEIRDEHGRFVARVDFAYPEAMIAIEIDGTEWHSRPRDVARDGRRQNALIKLGWLVYRIASVDLRNRAHHLAADLRSLHESRRSLVKK